MSSPFQSLFRSAAVLSGVNASLSLGALLLLPIYTRFLDPSEYGLAQILLVSTSVSGIFVRLGIPSGVMRHYNYVHAGEAPLQKLAVSTAGAFVVVASGLYAALLLPFASQLSGLLFDSDAYALVIGAGLAIVGLSSIEAIADCALRANYRGWAQAAVAVGGFIARAALTLYLLVDRGWGFESLVWGHVSGRVFSASIGAFLARDHLVWKFSRGELAAMLRYSTPLVLSSASLLVMSVSDRYFLRYLATTTDVGLYSMGDRLAGIINLFLLGPLLRMWGTTFFRIAREDHAEERLAGFTTYFIALGVLAVLAVLCGAELPVILLLDPAFHESVRVIGVLGFAYFLFGLHEVFKIGLNITGRSAWLPVPVVCGAVLNLIGNWVLIPPLGYTGAAVATVIAYGSLASLSFVLSRRVYPIPYELRKIAASVAAGGVVLAGYAATGSLELEWRVPTRAAAVLGYAAFLVSSGVVDPRRLWSLARKR